MTGTGSYADPKRPLFAPTASDPNGISEFVFEPSDDGRFAIVEFGAKNQAALRAILSDQRARCFERHKDKKDDVEKELKKIKGRFDFGKFRGAR